MCTSSATASIGFTRATFAAFCRNWAVKGLPWFAGEVVGEYIVVDGGSGEKDRFAWRRRRRFSLMGEDGGVCTSGQDESDTDE